MERLAHSPAEVAQMLGISERLVYAALADGRLARVKIGNRTLVPDTSVQALLAAVAPRPAGQGGASA